MVAGTKMNKQSNLYNRVVYLAIPKRLFDDDICKRAYRYIKSMQPLATIDPREIFQSNEEWAKNGLRYLKPCDCVVVVTDNGIVGKGVCTELQFFTDHKFPCYAYVERGKEQTLLTVTGVRVINENDWIHYARLEYE